MSDILTELYDLDIDGIMDEDQCDALYEVLVRAGSEIKRTRTQADALAEALRLAKEMFIANDLDLPKTFEVMDEALAAYEEGKR